MEVRIEGLALGPHTFGGYRHASRKEPLTILITCLLTGSGKTGIAASIAAYKKTEEETPWE